MEAIKAPFNMAISTLERISGILSDMHKTNMDSMLSPAQKQFLMVSQVKHLFSQATPLMEGGMVEDLMERVLKLTPKEKVMTKTKNGISFGKISELIYDKELDDEILRLSIEIQTKLQSLGYFMPPRKNLGTIVGSFD
jgi:hypothetical protein